MAKLFLPSMYTSVRVNTKDHDIDVVQHQLADIVSAQCSQRLLPDLKVHRNNQVEGCLLLPTRVHMDVEVLSKQIIVDYLCGMAVLRGASVFRPGIMSAPGALQNGDLVSVFADISKKCLKGMKEYDGAKLFIGNGVSYLARHEIFNPNEGTPRLAIEITQPILQSPSLNNVLTDKIFLQNVPSHVAGLVLEPRPGDVVLDMCAAPGGKSTHLYALMQARGTLVAIDRSKAKLDKIRRNFSNLFADDWHTNVKILNLNSVTLKDDGVCKQHDIPCVYDRILLDAPCSALGQRPRLCSDAVITDHVMTYPKLQVKLIASAVQLLKPGGTLVYCTCTTTLTENEEMVEWALRNFPCLKLVPQLPHVGGRGREGTNLALEHLDMLQYFPTTDGTLIENQRLQLDESVIHATEQSLNDCDAISRLSCTDTNGFFIAKFVKVDAANLH